METLEKAKKNYLSYIINRPLVDCNSPQEELENEANWIETLLVQILNKYAKSIKITAYFKC